MSSSTHRDEIPELSGLESIRTRPSMYLGSVNARGLLHYAQAGIDLVLIARPSAIVITINEDSVRIDSDKAIPTARHEHGAILPFEGVPVGAPSLFRWLEGMILAALSLECTITYRDQLGTLNHLAYRQGVRQPVSEVAQELAEDLAFRICYSPRHDSFHRTPNPISTFPQSSEVGLVLPSAVPHHAPCQRKESPLRVSRRNGRTVRVDRYGIRTTSPRDSYRVVESALDLELVWSLTQRTSKILCFYDQTLLGEGGLHVGLQTAINEFKKNSWP